MKAVIVDAGHGSRLYPITKCISKGLVPVYDKPALMYQLAFLAEMDVKDVAVVVSETYYDTYRNFLNQIDMGGLSISLYQQEIGTGFIAAYESCSEFTKGNDILLIMGDCLFFAGDTETLIGQAETCFRSGKVGIVIGNTLCENADPGEAKKRSSIGMYFVPRTMSGSLDGFVQLAMNDSDLDSVYTKLLQSGRILFPQYSADDAWFDIGTAERLFAASSYVRRKKNNSAAKTGNE